MVGEEEGKEDVDMFIMSCLWGVLGEMYSRKLDSWNVLYLSEETLKLSTLCNLIFLGERMERMTA